MSRPQIFIWYELTAEREYEEKIAEEKAEWNRTANILAMLHNTQMGIEKESDLKEASEFMPDLDKKMSNDELIDKAKEKGLNVPKEGG